MANESLNERLNRVDARLSEIVEDQRKQFGLLQEFMHGAENRLQERLGNFEVSLSQSVRSEMRASEAHFRATIDAALERQEEGVKELRNSLTHGIQRLEAAMLRHA